MAEPQLATAIRAPQSPRQTLAISILALCCLCWGFSFPAMQITANKLENAIAASSIQLPAATGELTTRATFNAWRFAFASLVYLLITFPRQRNFSRTDILGGLAVGSTFCIGILLQLIGLRYTLPSTSSFLTALSVVFAPLAQAILLRRRVGVPTILAIIIALIGMIVLNQANPDAHTARTLVRNPPIPHLGEILTIIGALIFTFQILAIDRFGPKADPNRLTFIMLLSCCLLSLIIGLSLGGHRLHRIEILSKLSADKSFLLNFAGLFIVSSAIAQHLMNKYQPLVSPATASVVYCLEPVFGTLFSVAFGTERLSAITIVGGIIILSSVVIVARKSKP
jgi:drug/metabolite transporter (DMT)-like permease